MRYNRSTIALLVICAIYVFTILNQLSISTSFGPFRYYFKQMPLNIFVEREEESQLVFSAFNDSRVIHGREFNSSLRQFLFDFGLTTNHRTKAHVIKSEDVVFVTYASSNHFLESRAGIIKLRNQFPNQIVYYDMGLDPTEADDIKGFCNLTYRKFNYGAYPKHIENLMNYGFKAIIEAEVYTDFPAYWMFDASIRIVNATLLAKFYDAINDGKFAKFTLPHYSGHSIYFATNPGMYEYLPISEVKKRVPMGSAISFIVRSDFSREVVKWFVLCALTEQCLAPSGHSIPCNFKLDVINDYSKCHRYDQSAINIVLSALSEKYEAVPYPYTPEVKKIPHNTEQGFIDIVRGDKSDEPFASVCGGNQIRIV